MWDGSSGATPELTRETRVLPSLIPDFGLSRNSEKRDEPGFFLSL